MTSSSWQTVCACSADIDLSDQFNIFKSKDVLKRKILHHIKQIKTLSPVPAEYADSFRRVILTLIYLEKCRRSFSIWFQTQQQQLSQ